MCKSPKLKPCFISMDFFKQFVNSADGTKASTSDSSTLLRITDLLLKKTSLERPAVPLSGESRYLTQLWVFGNREPFHPSDASLPSITSLEPSAEKLVTQYHEIKDKIRAALKLLTFREQHVLVQFWLPQVVGKHRLLTTVDQPFGIGVVDERLFSYRRDSECNPFLVNKDHEEEDCGPPARVYRRGLPEWTEDLTNYMPNDFTLQESAIRCNLLGYLALPVFDSTTSLCVGVLELLMSNKYTSCAYEVQQIHTAFKTTNLTTPQVFDRPTSNVPSDRMDKIHRILKVVCDNHGLPLAQTWAVSSFSNYVVHEKGLEKICNSYNTKCIGKVCMYTAALPFYVRDMGMWQFRDACRERHLEKTRGFVGRALVTHGSCFCADVSELSAEEYPLVYNARMSELASCFTIFLHSFGDDDYVLEFFLPLTTKDSKYTLKLVETLKQTIGDNSGFELGDVSSIEVVEPFEGNKHLSLDIEPHIIQISSTTEANTMLDTDSSDSELIVAETVIAPSHWSSIQNDDTALVGFGKINGLKQRRKRKIDSLTIEAIQQHFGKPIGQAAESLGVGRSTLKRFCREHKISSWPMARHSKDTAIVTDSNLSKKAVGMFTVVFLVIKVKRWSCSIKRHGCSSRWWFCGKHRRISSEFYFSIRQVAHLVMSLRRWRTRSSLTCIDMDGFRKVDPDRWEFANEGFLRGQKHLLKTIVRRKATSGHHQPPPQPHQQTSSVGACVEVGKFCLEEEAERLKRDKNVIMQELVRLRQQQQTADNQMQSMVQSLQGMEQRQQQMMSVLAKAVNSTFCLKPYFPAQDNTSNSSATWPLL